jgi:hypothetical protein
VAARMVAMSMTDADPVAVRATPERDSPTGIVGQPYLVARSAGIAGIAFSLLFVASLVLVSIRPPDGLDELALVDWYVGNALGPVTIASLYVAPFAGIAFLWFIGVIRARIGAREDQLFATVFLGSGLLFVGMYWAGAAQYASLVAGNRFDAAPPLTAAALEAVRSSAFSFLFVLAARAAAVFVLVTSTIIWRSRVLPHVLAIVGYAIGLVMLLSLSFLQWMVMLFPVWVFVVSAVTLSVEWRRYGTDTS